MGPGPPVGTILCGGGLLPRPGGGEAGRRASAPPAMGAAAAAEREEWGFCADVRALVGAFAGAAPGLGLQGFLRVWEGGGGPLLHAARPPPLEPAEHTALLFAAALRELRGGAGSTAAPAMLPPTPAVGGPAELGARVPRPKSQRGRASRQGCEAAAVALEVGGGGSTQALTRARRWGGWYATATMWALQPALRSGARPVPIYLPLPALQALDEILAEGEALGETDPAQLLLGLLRRDALVVGACPGVDFRTAEAVARSGGAAQTSAAPPTKRHLAAPDVAQAAREGLWEVLGGPLAGAAEEGLGVRAAEYASLLGEFRPGIGTGAEECARQAEHLAEVYRAALEEILGPREATEWEPPGSLRAFGRSGNAGVSAGGERSRPLPFVGPPVQLDAEDEALLQAVPQKHRLKVRKVLEATKRRRLALEVEAEVAAVGAAPQDHQHRAADSAAARSLVLRHLAGAPGRCASGSSGSPFSGGEEEDYDAADLEQQVEQALMEDFEAP